MFPWTSFAVLPTLKNFSAIVPKTSKFIRKSWSFQDFLWEMLLCKFSSGHVESSFDNIAKNFPVKTQVFFFSKSKKRRKTNCSSVFFWRFSCVHLDYCFDTPDWFFCQNQKKLTQSPKKDVISINHFHHFFSKFCWGHAKSTFSNLPELFLSKVRYFRSETKNNQTITLLSKKTSKRSLHPKAAALINLTKSLSQKSNNFAQRPKKLSKTSSFQRNVL